jgi:hypothetical protein
MWGGVTYGEQLYIEVHPCFYVKITGFWDVTPSSLAEIYDVLVNLLPSFLLKNTANLLACVT